jgi:hypothetical protein
MQAKLRGSDGLASAKAAQSAGPSLCCYKPLLPAHAKPCVVDAATLVLAPRHRLFEHRDMSLAIRLFEKRRV